MNWRPRQLLALGVCGAAVGVGALVWQHWGPAPPKVGPTVVLVILDTVRADRTSVCGHEKPTTPTLDGLVARGAAVSCDTYAPGAWTLPSHASFFTGVPVWEHGSTLAAGGEVGKKLFSFAVHPLDPSFPTLAEGFAARGYATALVSENSVVGPKTDLSRGYEHVASKYRCGKPADEWLYPKLDATLDRFERQGRPLFLTVNICQAHDPRWGAPDDVDWVDHHEPARFRREEARQFVAGELQGADRELWLAQLDDAYDWSVHQADAALGHLLTRLQDEGWAKPGLRLVVTSDHGEMLGEHDRIDHMEYLWEENARIPLVVYDTTGVVALPTGPLPGVAVHDLTLHGRLPDPLPPVAAVSAPARGRPDKVWPETFPVTAMAAHWDGTDKRLVHNGQDLAVDLATDPHESAPGPAPDDEAQTWLRGRYEAVQTRAGEQGAEGTDELLRELGYVE